MPLNPGLRIDLGSARPPFPNEPPAPTAAPANTPSNPTAPSSSSGLNPPANRDEAEQRLREQLRVMQSELDGSKQELAASQAALESARASAAAARLAPVKAAPGVKVESQGQSNMRLSRAQNAAGGTARYTQLPLQERLAMLGFPPPSQADIDDCPRFFGRQSNSSQAMGLARTNPSRYSYLRHLSRELGVR